jgi:hypothetical protein
MGSEEGVLLTPSLIPADSGERQTLRQIGPEIKA